MIINYTTDTDTDTNWFLASEKYLALLVWNRVSGPDYTEIRKRPWHANRVLRYAYPRCVTITLSKILFL